jgi:hypothetical protein
MKEPQAMPRLTVLLTSLVLFGGCIHVKLDPIEVHATLDVNVKVDRALDDFFGDLDKKAAAPTATPATTPATPAAK